MFSSMGRGGGGGGSRTLKNLTSKRVALFTMEEYLCLHV